MKSVFCRIVTAIVVILPAVRLWAQPAAPANAGLASDEVVVLSPFTVETGEDRGYRASNSIGGTRVNTALKDVPMNIQVVTEEFMRDIAAIDASESLKFQSGVLVGSRDGDRDTSVTIRGFGTTWQMREGFRRYDTSDSINIARQEVVSGPAAVLYGISQPGGIINYITKRPQAGQFAEIRQTVGSYGFFRTELDVNYNPEGPLALRLMGAYTDTEGFRDFEYTERTFIAPVLTYQVGEKTTLTVDLEHMEQDRGFTTNKLRDVSLTPTGGTTNLPGFLNVPREQQWSGDDTVHENTSTNLLVILDHQFNENFSLNTAFNTVDRVQQRTTQTHRGFALTALRDRTGALVTDGSGNPIKAIRTLWANDYNDNRMWQVRADAVVKMDLFGSPQKFLIGANYAKDTNYRKLFEDRNISTANAVDSLGQNFRYYAVSERNPNLQIGNENFNPVSWARPWLNYEDPIEVTSFYLNEQGSFFGGRLLTLLGIRYDRNDYSREWKWRRTGQVDVKNSVTDKWSPNLGALYKVAPWFSLYALTSESLEPRNGATNSFGVNLDPSYGESREAGAKFELMDGRISGTFSFFEIKNQNLPVNDPTAINASGGLGDTIQVGEQTTEGFDFTGFYFPTDKIQITGGWSYVDNFISADTNAANLGRNFSNLPYNRWSLFASYKLGQRLTFGGGAVYTGEIARGWNDASGQRIKNDAYTMYDLFVRYQWTMGRQQMTASLNALNLGNEEDWGGGNWIEGRTVRATIGLRF